ncbi:MAG: ABC transporter substrate-binding protein [Tissierellia bacterium]|nr:ABC transporter substrate-binding protein [Tissierellia bacterium]
MKKRSIVLLLILAMVMTTVLAACGGGDKPAEDKPAEETPAADKPAEETPAEEPAEEGKAPKGTPGTLIVGSGTELSNDWTSYWDNNASNADIRFLTSGYDTMVYTPDGKVVINPTSVKNHEITENADGSHTHTWTIADNLVWDDGTPITAKNYVAGFLLWGSQAIADMGGSNSTGNKVVGYTEYSTGETDVFSGVRLVDDYTFSVTISPDWLPTYYEDLEASSGPTAWQFYTSEEMDIVDEGEGVKFTLPYVANPDKDGYDAKWEERMKEARVEVPRPASGAYKISEFDQTAKTATLVINDKFLGNFEGTKPSIPTVVYKLINPATQFDEFKTGGVDILMQTASGDEINQGLDLVESMGFKYVSYPRAGYGKLTLACDFGPTQFPAVRHAIAHLLNRQDFAKAFTGGFGSLVHGPYGEAQWFYQESKAELNKVLNQYPYDPAEAIRILEEDGWTKNADGGEYTEGIRYKEVDGELMPLSLNWCSTENNPVSDMLVVRLMESKDVADAGMEIKQEVMTFPELLAFMTRDGSKDDKYTEPKFHLFNLATGFYPVYDQTFAVSMEPQYLGWPNSAWIKDEVLANAAKDMVARPSDDDEGYKESFVKYVTRWNELLPEIPLYSNIYHDFYNPRIEGYANTPFTQFDYLIINMKLAD